MTRLEPKLLPVVVALEDSDEDLDTMQVAIRKSELAVELRRVTTSDACINGLDALSSERVRPALMLLDLSTPGTDGREAPRLIRSDPALKDLVIAVLTTSANSKDLRLCYEAGANAYDVKPPRCTEYLGALLDVFAYWFRPVALPEHKR